MNRPNPPSTDREAQVPDHSDELMKRFLVGEVSNEERDAIEQRFIEEPAFFEALGALEHEMLLSLVQNTLPERWAGPLRSVLADSPDRRRHFEEMQRLVQALGQAPAKATPIGVRAPASPDRWWLQAAAVLVVGIGLGAWWWAGRPASEPPVAVELPAAGSSEGLVASFVLVAGPTRSPDGEDNALRIPAGVERVRFSSVLAGSSATVVGAAIRAIGGATIDVPAETTVRHTAEGAEVVWTVPAAPLVPGDYLITFSVPAAGGGAETIGSRFVRILK